MSEEFSPSVQAQVERAGSDPDIQSVIEVSLPALARAGLAEGFRRILFLTKQDTCRRILQINEGEVPAELFWVPGQKLLRAVEREGRDSWDFDIVQCCFDRSGGRIPARLAAKWGRKRASSPRYCPDVKYLAYRKILRIAEDARKCARRGSPDNARLLLWMALVHLARYAYVRDDRPVPTRIRIAEDLGQDGGEAASLLREASSRQGVEVALEHLFGVLKEYEEDYPWPAWNWESKALRFGRAFDFEALVFSESNSRLWRLWDRWGASPAAVLPHLEKAGRRDGATLKELKAEIGKLAGSLPGITAALVMGSGAHRDADLRGGLDSDLDVVFFTRSLYLKRFFLRLYGVCIDGIVISEKAAEIGLKRGAPIVVVGCAGGEILHDSRGTLGRLQKEAQALFRRPPAPLSPGELAYALAKSRWNLARLSQAPKPWDAGMLFLLFEEFIRVVYLMTGAAGVWTAGEQWVLPSLKEHRPEMAAALEGFLQGEGASYSTSFRTVLEMLKEISPSAEGEVSSESRRTFLESCCFDL